MRGSATWRIMVGPVTIIFASIVALLQGFYANTVGDFNHMLDPMQNLFNDGVGGVYVEGVDGTSLTGWLLLTIAPFVFGQSFFSEESAWVLAGLVAVPLLVGGVRYAARSIWPTMSVERAWGLAALSLVLPTTFSSWVEYYHPQDVAAVGVMLFGLGLAAKNQWGLAGVVFGFAIMTRQWVLLVAIAIAPLAGSKNVLKYALAGTVTVAACIAPLVLTGNENLFYALSAKSAAITNQTLLGRALNSLESPPEMLRVFFRLLPVLGATVVALVAWGKKWGVPYLVPVAVTAMSLRMVFETAPYTYYWVPVPILLLLLTKKKEGVLAGVALSLLVWPVRPFGESPFGEMLVSVLVLLFACVVILLAWTIKEDGVFDGELNSAKTKSWMWLTSGVVAAIIFVAGFPFVSTEKEKVFAVVRSSEEAALQIINVEETAPVEVAFENGVLSVLRGQSFQEQEFNYAKGAPVVVGVFSHWCELCPSSAKEFLEWSQENQMMGDGKISSVGVFTGSDASKGNWPTGVWLLSMEWDIPSVKDDSSGSAGSVFGFTNEPVFVVVGPNGEVVDRWQGDFDAQRADAASALSP